MSDRLAWFFRGEWIFNSLLRHQHLPVFGHTVRTLMYVRGTDVPRSVRIGEHVRFRHGAAGVVMHTKTTIGNRVSIFQHVTLGRADVYRPIQPDFGGIVIEDDVILGKGAVVLARGPEPLHVARGCVIGANAVLLQSTRPEEVWVGNPARCVGQRSRASDATGAV